ncbi:MAG: class I SAM-dependent methyltransferase [Syntrophales bacterium]|jgi:hypothetical protein|nr:class I SAM-dependent methyltransferase [Syntrophales bacterium]MCK9527352.1 class I SAM-dependent methyltransferase [Syntrophales bacterium]MDX9921178.1 class I SAM-dependent methyltransferase [Syntrophales bacterium]
MKRISTTEDFYSHGLVDLMTEYTICESLGSIDSPYMAALEEPRTFGASLGRMLADQGVLRAGMRVCEVGGGYGSLMRGLLESRGDTFSHVTMLDLSRQLLERQRRVLFRWREKVSFVNGNIQSLLPGLSGIDLFIMNEVAGDLKTWINLDPKNLPEEAARFVDRYGLDIPSEGFFHFNMGVLLVVEELCRKGRPAFLSEHSSDPLIPHDMDYLGRDLERNGYPREIRLRGHSEYTVRFSHVADVARGLGRKVVTGSLADLVGLAPSPRLRAVFLGRMTASDENAVLYELLDHIREYRWLLIL